MVIFFEVLIAFSLMEDVSGEVSEALLTFMKGRILEVSHEAARVIFADSLKEPIQMMLE